MTVRVIWTERAFDELIEIAAYIDQFDPAAAETLTAQMRHRADSLADFPRKGRLIRRGLRQIKAVHPYILRYRIKGDLIAILRVYHGARNVRSPRLDYSAQPAIA